jgi:hypothetical protein
MAALTGFHLRLSRSSPEQKGPRVAVQSDWPSSRVNSAPVTVREALEAR